MAHSDALATHVRRRVERLEHLSDRVLSCHVVVELASHRHRHGDRYRISINLSVPGHELRSGHAPSSAANTDNVYATADRALDEAERQLEDWTRRLRAGRHDAARVST